MLAFSVSDKNPNSGYCNFESHVMNGLTFQDPKEQRDVRSEKNQV